MSASPYRGMRRVFLRFYFTVAGCFLIAALLIGAAYKQVVERANMRYLTDIFQAATSIIIRELQDLPPSLWHNEVSQIADRIPVPVQIDSLESYTLSPENQRALQAGDIIRLYNQDQYLLRIENTDLILVMGPIHFLTKTDGISFEDAMALFLMCVALGVPAWLWLRPLWRDLLELSRQGGRLGEGDFSARVILPDNSALAVLGEAFNRMAFDVETLTASRRAMIDAVSHDLRTPLARLRYRLEALRAGANQENTIQAVERDLNSIDALIEEWLTMSSLNKPEMKLDTQTFEIVPWLEKQLQDYTFNGGAVLVKNETGDPQPQVSLDMYYLARCMSNLMSNSSRYGANTVQIILQNRAGMLDIHVDDDGPGIPEQERVRILQPFERLEPSRNRKTGGFGLGLAIVAMVMRHHGGDVCIAESSLGGARVTLSLPWV